MNKTYQLFLLLLGVLLSAGCLSGCIKDNLSDCPVPVEPKPEPTTGIFRLALTYTMHNMLENGTYADLFSQQVHKIDVFVFNDKGQFVKQITEEAAPKFADNYIKEIELPGGNYQFVVWGNHYEDETVHNCNNETSLLQEGRMTLAQTLNQNMEIGMLTDSLFHGYTPQAVSVENGKSQEVSINLMKNRNDVRVIIRWHEKGTIGYCTRPEHAHSIKATLVDNNTTYDFFNNIVDKQEVIYQPGHFPYWYDPLFNEKMQNNYSEQDYAYVADFSELRLMKDNSDSRLVIQDNEGKIVYEHALSGPDGLITQLEQYQTQEALDREDRYLIELLFECESHAPWSAITIMINGWTLVDKDIEL